MEKLRRKRNNLTLLLVVALFVVYSSYSQTKFNDGTYEYTIIANTTNVSIGNYGTKPVGAITLPSEVIHSGITYTVTSISPFGFLTSTNLTEVIIPSSFTSLGFSAFQTCISLQKVTLPTSITSIDYGAFNSCSSLTDINLPQGLLVIEAFAFNSCSALQNIEIPSTVTSIGSSAFNFCSSLSEFTCNLQTPLPANDLFFGSGYMSATLFVPSPSAKSLYEFTFGWSSFNSIEIIAPDVTSLAPKNIESNKAILQANIINEAGGIVERGFVYSLTNENSNPEIGGLNVNQIVSNSSSLLYEQEIANLLAASNYSFKAYAKSNYVTGYGNLSNFTTALYTETFSIENKGILSGTCESTLSSCTNTDFTGVDWTFDGNIRNIDAQGFYTQNGILQTNAATGSDGTPICWVSPNIDISTSAVSEISMDITWTGLDATDFIDVQFSIDGGNFISIPNQIGGGENTIRYTTNNNTGNTSLVYGGIVGNSLQLKVCVRTSTGSEIFTLDNVMVEESVSSSPIVSTSAASNITNIAATFGGEIVSTGGTAITEQGFVLSETDENANPTVGGQDVLQFVDGSNTTSFSLTQTNLRPNTSYSYTSYATNSNGTSYGVVQNFTTSINYPSNVANEIALWVKADFGPLTTATGNYISDAPNTDNFTLPAWVDVSGNGTNEFTNSDLTSPVYKNNATDNINFNPVVDFAGDVGMRFSTEVYSSGTGNEDGMTWFVIVKPDDTASSKVNQFVFDFGAVAGEGYGLVYGEPRLSTYTPSNFGGSSFNTVPSTTTNTALGRFTIDFNNIQTFHINGETNASLSTAITLAKLTSTEIREQDLFTIGRQAKAGSFGTDPNTRRDFDGKIAEIIGYRRVLNATEVNKIESYLALKYGITKDNTDGCKAGDYVDANNTLLWDASVNSMYQNNIIGIGRDDVQQLNQKQSKVTDESFSVYKGTLATTNLENSDSFSNDNSFVLIGDNTGQLVEVKTELPSSIDTKLEREWKITKTNLADTFSIEITLDASVNPSNISLNRIQLLVDTDGDFSNGGTSSFGNGDNGLTFSQDNLKITIANISNNHIPNNATHYFTLGNITNTIPSVGSVTVSNLASTSVTLQSEVTNDGGSTVSESGFVYALTNENNNPEIGGANVTKVAVGNGTGTFNENITGLTANSEHTVKAYAINSVGTSYGSSQTFTTNNVPFITTWQTKIPNETITIPTFGAGYNYTVDWGDGTSSNNITSNATHTYTSPNTYTVAITGTFRRIYFNDTGDKDKIISVEQWGDTEWTSFENAFFGCSNLVVNASDTPDLSNVSNMNAMFKNATSFNQPVNNWQMGNVEYVVSMFEGATSFNQTVNNWDTTLFESMEALFKNAAAFNQELYLWSSNLKEVQSMRSMFEGATNFNKSVDWSMLDALTDASYMFTDATSFNSTLNLDGDIEDMSSMFERATSFNHSSINNLNTASATNMSYMFSGATAFNQGLNWDTSNVQNMTGMFRNATNFDQDLSSFEFNSISDLDLFLTNVQLSTTNYDALLDRIYNTATGTNITLDGGLSTYCLGENSRNRLINIESFTITDGGKDLVSCKYNWIGSNTGDWDTSSNWRGGHIPNQYWDIIIPSNTAITATNAIELKSLTLEENASLKITNHIETNNTAVTLENGASLIIQDGNNFQSFESFDFTYHRKPTTTNWYLIASPTNNQTKQNLLTYNSSVLASGNNGNRGIGFYDNLNSGWNYIKNGNTGNLVTGQGMTGKLQNIGNAFTFKGTMTLTDIQTSLSDNSSSGGNAFNLLGNPYPSYLPINFNTSGDNNNLFSVNTLELSENTIWLWNQATNTYQAFNNLATKYLAPTQGFFVKSKQGGGTFSFTKAMQSVASSDTFQKTSNPIFKVELIAENNKIEKQTDFYYLNDATKGWDNGYDSTIFGGLNSSFSIFSELLEGDDTKELAIQALPNENYADLIIPIGVKLKKGENLKFKTKVFNKPSDINVYIEDRLNSTITNLNNNEDYYELNLEEDVNGTGRFYLHTSSEVLATNQALQQTITIYKLDNSTLRITGLNTSGKVTLYDMLGKNILQKQVIGTLSNEVSLPQKLPSGFYLVQLTTESRTLNKKIFFE